MTYPQAGDPVAGATSDPVPRKTRRRIDWRRGARLLAEGKPPEEAAVALGIDGERFWRHLETSPAFQQQVVAAIRQRNALTAILAEMGVRSVRPGTAGEWLARLGDAAHPDNAV